MKRSELKRSTPMPRATTGLLRVASSAKKAPARKATLKTKQRAVTPTEKAVWGRLANLGCIACMKEGSYNPHVSIHHIDGRTKPGCHMLVLPLCGSHHQDDGSGVLAVHPWKARFEKRYGAQLDLVAECMNLIGEK